MMGKKTIDLATWQRRDLFHLFRSYAQPHYALTTRLDVTQLMTVAKPAGVSPYRATIYAIGAGLHKVPALCQRFQGDDVYEYDRVELSMSVPAHAGGFNFAYIPFVDDFDAFDRICADGIEKTAQQGDLQAHARVPDQVAYLSCLPWLDFTAVTNAMPEADDCIPRISWGKIVETLPGRWEMAMGMQVHHALVDGEHLGVAFTEIQRVLQEISAQ